MGYRLKRVPTVLTVHGLDWQRAKWKGVGAVVLKQAERCGVRFADEIIVVSSSLKDYFFEQYTRHTTLIHNAIKFQPASLPGDGSVIAQYGLRPQRYVVFVGRLVPEKRVDDLIRAFRQVETDFKLAIVGEGAAGHVSDLKSLAGSDPRIIFTGLQEQARLHELFHFAAAYVLPSELEGFPLSLMECIGHGVPAIVSDIPPHRELLEPVRDYNLFFSVRNAAELSERLSGVLSDPQRYRQLAEAAREYVRQAFSIEQMVDRTEEVLLRAFNRHRSR
jgi:glycosyltransferase involved in cell wall biosynthesis